MVNNLQAMNIDSVFMNNNKLVVSSTPAEIAEGKYMLINTNENLTVQSTYDFPESSIIAAEMGESIGMMQWNITKVSNKSACKLESTAYKKVMSLKAKNKNAGTPVVNSNDLNLTSQMWVFCPVQSDSSQVYVIRNVCSGMYLQLNCPGESGSKLIQGNLTNSPLERFMLIPCIM